MGGLDVYREKRDFTRTPEPSGGDAARSTGRGFVIQKHAASKLHYDFRLELDGVLKSWAVPKGPSLDPGVKSLAVQVEDHPLAYASFEGTIPEGHYGGGTVMVWDSGEWEPRDPERAAADLARGKLVFRVHGQKLHGEWTLVRMKGAGDDGRQWLLIKRDDDAARPAPEPEIVESAPLSVLSGRSLEEIAAQAKAAEGERDGEGGHPRTGAARRAERATGPDADSTDAADEPLADPSTLEGAVRAPPPSDFRPQLAEPTDEIPVGDAWLHELKFDGYRLICRVDGGRVRLLSRGGQDWTGRFRAVAVAVQELGLDSAILDGELVALDDDGRSHFQLLQNALRDGRTEQLCCYLFDAPYLAGHDLRGVRLLARKQLLAGLLLSHAPGNDGVLRLSKHVRGHGADVLANSCASGREGVVSKHAESPYEMRRASSWRKSKCLGRQEFVIGGFTAPRGSREHLGALLVGYREDDRWRYAGRVGTGFGSELLADLGRRLQPLRRDAPAFVDPPRGARARDVTWVEPRLVAEIAFSEWTDDGRLRQPVFLGLREDKGPEEVRREALARGARSASAPPPRRARRKEPAMTGSRSSKGGDELAGVRLTHPDRVLDSEQGLTKRALAEYYVAVAEHVLPHVTDRPLSIVRCPRGRDGKCFYQKHWTESLPSEIDSVMLREKEGEAPYLVIHDLPGLVALVQMSALELHPWGARVDRIERPDRLVLDLDPGEGVAFAELKQAAREVRERLEQCGLRSFVRTTGGKGLHVVAPITRRNSWDELADFAERLARDLARGAPKRYVTTMRKSARKGRIFLDHLRNRRGATAVASYSTRARPGAPVAVPLAWEELDELSSAAAFGVDDVPARLEQLDSDPWAGFDGLRQSITRDALRALED